MIVLGLHTVLVNTSGIGVFGERLSRSSVQHSGTALVLCLLVIFTNVFDLDVLRPRTSIVTLIFRYASTLDAMNSDLSLAPALKDSDGLVIVILVFVKQMKILALVSDLVGRGGVAGCGCPDSGVVVG